MYKYLIDTPDNKGEILATQSVAVTAGNTTVANFDLSSTTGFVKGSLTVNGTASRGRVQFCGPDESDPCPITSSGFGFDAANGTWTEFEDSGFSIPVLPGNYRAHIITTGKVDVGIVPITVAANTENNDSALDASISLGTIHGSILWDSQNADPPNWVVKFIGTNTGFTYMSQYSSSSYNSGAKLPSDTYTVTVYKSQYDAPDSIGEQVGSHSVVVGSGQSVTSNFDLSATTGLVKGGLKINGTDSRGWVQFCGPDESDPCTITSSGLPFDRNNGPYTDFETTGFAIPVLPGNYRVHVISTSNQDAGIVPITVTQGAENNETGLHFQLNSGQISGVISWGSQSPDPENWVLKFVGSSTGFTYTSNFSSNSYNTGPKLPPDTYTITVYKAQADAADNEGYTVATSTAVVGAGQSVTKNFNLNSNTGLVTGNLVINGVDSRGWIQYCGPLTTDPCPISPTDNPFVYTNGSWTDFETTGFKLPVLPGSYCFHVISTSRVDMGKVCTTVVVGTVNDLGTLPVAGPVVAINAGGSTSGSFVSDTYVSGGTAYSTSDSVDTSGVDNPAPQAVYQTVRYGNFTYTIPDLIPSSAYTLKLHFNELYFGTTHSGGGSGSRVFNVSVNGTNKLSNYDIYQNAGGSNKAIVEQISATANSSGNIVINFASVVDNAMVSGIEVYSGTLPSPSPSPTPTPTPITSKSINSGGSSSGSFLADTDYAGGSTASTTASVDLSGVTSPAPEAVYQSGRYGNITYTVHNFVPGDSYNVKLHFNEFYWGTSLASGAGGTGSRVFNVSINGSNVLSNFDIFSTAGGSNKALIEQFNTTANTYGDIGITLTSVTDTALISGLEISHN